ncbi:Spore cortex protein YabQ (Spore_YabQ) [Psychrobacillus psychrotolerans]|uniref:Spore cortex protein YabQ (Spore_YabQ) n=1 Tax=Psychrobacillus psychrotolerans TaxID=126156 RepID=A0A1I6BB95_9BACI|nr:spore cortex biosynthesis protein YabQ [Psychrobacillus psychrotolerans]SFQ78215.1 Spore cortex protein YabQ (Spore_YabQ) [Psychrobacillus psychrotolerans]
MTLSLQFFSLLLMVCSGVLVGAIIEGTRFITESFPRRSYVYKYRVVLEVFVWIALGLGSFYILYDVRDGVWRIYDPLAQIVGILLYDQLFQPVFRLTGRIILRLIIQPIWWIIHFIWIVINKVIHLIWMLISFILKPFQYIFRKTWHLALQKKPNFRYNRKYTKKLK